MSTHLPPPRVSSRPVRAPVPSVPPRVSPGRTGTLLLACPRYRSHEVRWFRSLPGSRWVPAEKAWEVPDTPEVRHQIGSTFPGLTLPRPDPLWEGPVRGDPLELLRRELALDAYALRTQKAYVGHVRRFLRWWPQGPETAGADEVREYLLHLVDARTLSRSTQVQVSSALTYFYRRILRRPLQPGALPTPRKGHPLPRVPSREEIERMIRALRTPAHRALVMVLYSAGLRVSEAVRLRWEEVETSRSLLRVRGARGKKDRYTLLSRRALVSLEEQRARLGTPRPRWVFPGVRPRAHLTTRSAQKIVAAAGRSSGLERRVTPRVLRHALAAHLLEQGTDLRHIQELLGHASSRTTEICAQVSPADLLKIRSPLD